ncbi:hypothetical protein BKA70DRAFT_1562630 [Coprinopsis sp. MPI-PUGE-AT-0042]|nr:hypothetical protein BKA70DRAFT_1562630 [Coprinopsis sp. MPI-PUGE-AT-0042]
MSFLSNGVDRFIESLHPGPGASFHIVDDIFSVIVFTAFAVIQAQVLYRITNHLKHGDFKLSSGSGRLSGIAHVVLGVAYLICAVLVVADFMMKLGLTTQHTIVAERSWPVRCPSGYSNAFGSWIPACLDMRWLPLLTATKVIDIILCALFLVVLLLSDGLLLYRCSIVLGHSWARAIKVASGLRFGWFVFSPFLLPMSFGSLITIYVSLLTTLLASASLIAWLWHKKLEAKAAMSDSNIPFGESISTVIQATLPPIVLGFVHVGLFAGLQLLPVGLTAFWFSFTALASQTITLRILQQGDNAIMNGKYNQAITLPPDV